MKCTFLFLSRFVENCSLEDVSCKGQVLCYRCVQNAVTTTSTICLCRYPSTGISLHLEKVVSRLSSLFGTLPDKGPQFVSLREMYLSPLLKSNNFNFYHMYFQ